MKHGGEFVLLFIIMLLSFFLVYGHDTKSCRWLFFYISFFVQSPNII